MALDSILPIVEDKVAIKVLSMWQFESNIDRLCDLLALSEPTISKKVTLLRTCGLISDGGMISDEAKKLLLAKATKALKK